MPAERPIRVLIIDDSAVVRRLVTEALSADPAIEVVGSASDPFMAKDKIKQLSPDVLTLDLEMPRMDGLTFLGILMRERPTPTIVMSSLTKENSAYALEAIRLGAVDVLAKPGGSYSFGDLGPRLVLAVKGAARARLRRPLPPATSPSSPAAPGSAPSPAPAPKPERIVAPASALGGDPRRLIVLGASTGGTEALREVLTRLPGGLPPIAIVQHIPAHFSRAFAERLDGLCAFRVHEATDGEPLRPGMAVVAPGNYHLLLRWTGSGYRTELSSGPQVWHQRPAVDVLFNCAGFVHSGAVLQAVLTGMGKDGAQGLLKMRQAGARTFGQDEASCVVYGMPREAFLVGAVEEQYALDSIARPVLYAALR